MTKSLNPNDIAIVRPRQAGVVTPYNDNNGSRDAHAGFAGLDGVDDFDPTNNDTNGGGDNDWFD